MRCGAPLEAGRRFCSACGAPIGGAVPPPVAAAPPALAATGNLEKNPFLALAVVAGVCLVAPWILWSPLGWPARLVGLFVKPGDCSSISTGSWDMYTCSARVGLLTLVGPIIIMALVFVFRKAVANGVKALTPKIPPDMRFAIAPLVASLCFTMSWAAVHAYTADQTGFLPQRGFPAVIGIFTYVVVRFGGAIQDRFRSFFDTVQRIPKFLRIILTILLPMGIALLITNEERVSQTAIKEQAVVMLCLVCGYLAMSTRQGAQPANHAEGRL
jgi:hypothetical protein